jgi:tetratricopeptide (TPR) repeat protein
MTEQNEIFEKLTNIFSRWQCLLKQAYGIDTRTQYPSLYDILNSPQVEIRLKQDCPPLKAGTVNSTALQKRWNAAYHEIIRSSYWQNHEEYQFAVDIQTALNLGVKILADPAQEFAYAQWLGLAPLRDDHPTPIKSKTSIKSDSQSSNHHSIYNYANVVRQGVNLLEAGEYQAAIAQFNQAISLQSNASEAFASRALAWYKLGENLKAKQDCDQAIRIDPDFAWVYVLRGKTFHIAHQFDEATRDLTTAIQKLKQAIDLVNEQIKEADKAFDLSRAVELKHHKLADLKRKLREAETELAKIKTRQTSQPITRERAITRSTSTNRESRNEVSSERQSTSSLPYSVSTPSKTNFVLNIESRKTSEENPISTINSIIYTIHFFLLIFLVLLFFSVAISSNGEDFVKPTAIALTFILCINLVSSLGIWQMKKWSLYVYLMTTALLQVIFLASTVSNSSALWLVIPFFIVQLTVSIIALRNSRGMS